MELTVPRTASSRTKTAAGFVGAFLGLTALAACVPADEAVGLGGVEFTFTVSKRTSTGLEASETIDGWSIKFDRIVLGFKTMTIGKIGVTDVCAYRGRGAESDVVFDPRVGLIDPDLPVVDRGVALIQSFNGIQPTDCPDVGVIFGSPGPTTVPGAGASVKDIVELASSPPAIAIVEATVERASRKHRIKLRFDAERTATRFGGCREAMRGVRIQQKQRDEAFVRFAAEHLFRDSMSSSANLKVRPFVDSDIDGDGVVTMDELDRVRLVNVAPQYLMPNGSTTASFGDYVRVMYRFTIMFGRARSPEEHNENPGGPGGENGLCVGNEPGTEEGGQPAP
jgi:hypothetical protein